MTSMNEVVMWDPCPYIRHFPQLPHVHSGAFELCFSHRLHLWDPDSLTFTMVPSNMHFSLEPQGPLFAPRAKVHITCPHFIIKQLLYMFYFHICFTSHIWFECAGSHPRPPSCCQSWTPLTSLGIYSKLA
jgi:hypothetical protein